VLLPPEFGAFWIAAYTDVYGVPPSPLSGDPFVHRSQLMLDRRAWRTTSQPDPGAGFSSSLQQYSGRYGGDCRSDAPHPYRRHHH
jgi:hypothetical protein